MKPDFDELIGEEGSREEIEELRQVHELLLSADPPPRLDQRASRVPRIRSLVPRRWAMGAVGFAAAAAAVVGLTVGYTLGQGSGFQAGFSRHMHGVGATAAASARIKVGKEDSSGNRPLEMSVRSLPALPRGRWYELYLTKKGKPVVPCGIFQTGRSGAARVSMNAPADLAEYDGWIVTARVPGQPSHALLTT